jgi:hypothetical protein
MIVGAYDLHLYCEDPRHGDRDANARLGQAHWREYERLSPGRYAGETYADAVRHARADGWLVGPRATGRAICRLHRRGTSTPPTEGGC